MGFNLLAFSESMSVKQTAATTAAAAAVAVIGDPLPAAVPVISHPVPGLHEEQQKQADRMFRGITLTVPCVPF